jgi:hypothetical protein
MRQKRPIADTLSERNFRQLVPLEAGMAPFIDQWLVRTK